MNKTKIPWCDYTINPIKGLCKYACWYCYARRMYKQFKWNPEIRLDLTVFRGLEKLPVNSKVFVCSTHEIMGEWIPNNWINDIIIMCRELPHINLLFLTKNPARYRDFKFPKNCWLGTSVTGYQDWIRTIQLLFFKKDNPENIVFLSFEPLLDSCDTTCIWYSEWVIIGGLTPNSKHKKEWVEHIIRKARENNSPLFLKDNLHWHEKIQEFPNGIQR